MRIICDYCSLPISGAVKREAGNFNLHPDCPAQGDKSAMHQSTAVSMLYQEFSIRALVGRNETATGDSSGMQ
jgi:hypothetical protein